MDKKNSHLADVLGYKYVERSFFDYSMMSYGTFKGMKPRNPSAQKGAGKQVKASKNSFNKAYKCIKYILEDKRDDPYFYNLYNGIFMFCLDYEKVGFDDKVERKMCEMSTAVRTLSFPPSLEGEAIDAIDYVRANWKFEDFLEGCRTNPYVGCDIDSALDVYRMQGDEAIFGILFQVFAQFDGVEHFACQLIPEVEVKWLPEIDDFATGTTFPVFVSPFSKKLRWQESENGFFLETCLGGKWFVLDVLSVGHYFLGNQSTSARSNFWAGGGQVVPYLICWNWKELIDAVGYFGVDVLVRDFRSNLFNNYWARFGLGAKIVVKYNKKGIMAGKGEVLRAGKYEGASDGLKLGETTLAFDDVKPTNRSVAYSTEEMLDWGRISEMLQDSIRTHSLTN